LTSPLPGTGPYQIAAVRHPWNPTDHKRETVFDTLIRNPHFSQWSFAAQPAGYPDVIKWREYRNARTAVAAVRAGKLDIGGRRYGGDAATLAKLVADLRLHHPDRLHTQTLPDTIWESLNTQVPPFDNKLARQAVNYAVDRRTLLRHTYGPGLAAPTCQMLPPNFPAYRWHCPYTRPGPDAYNGPDLAKARRLVQRSGTRGAHVTLYQSIVVPTDRRLLADLAHVMTTLGYRVTPHPIECRDYSFCFPYAPRPRVQIAGIDGWIADYPTPDTFYDSLLSCRSQEGNRNGFCNPRIDRLAALARRTALTDPSAARRMWTNIDQLVTDEAPWIMLGSDVAFQYTSARVRNYQSTPFQPIYDQLWVH
jgi:ABC-type transport system substrate-binding protein